VLSLLNQSKCGYELAEILKLANISSLWTMKSFKMELSNDRGIFVLTVFRMIMDRILYNEKEYVSI
jgi:hypothetical protein